MKQEELGESKDSALIAQEEAQPTPFVKELYSLSAPALV